MEAKRPFSQLDWLSTPEPVRAYIVHLEQVIGQMQQRLDLLEKRTEKLEVESKKNQASRHLPIALTANRRRKPKKANASVEPRKITKGINNSCWNQPKLKT